MSASTGRLLLDLTTTGYGPARAGMMSHTFLFFEQSAVPVSAAGKSLRVRFTGTQAGTASGRLKRRNLCLIRTTSHVAIRVQVATVHLSSS